MCEATFRPFHETDTADCLLLFDANCPEYFAANEREDYCNFLQRTDPGYWVCELDGKICGAFGVFPCENQSIQLNWILVEPQHQGAGIGSTMMEQAIATAKKCNARRIKIAASHKSAPFFELFGARAVSFVANGWGPGMDRIDMELSL